MRGGGGRYGNFAARAQSARPKVCPRRFPAIRRRRFPCGFLAWLGQARTVSGRGKRRTCVYFFLRKRSRRTTSPPPVPGPFPGSGGLAAVGGEAGTEGGWLEIGAGGVMGFFFLEPSRGFAGGWRSWLSLTSSNCNPNRTDGSKKPLIASNG